MADAAQLFVTCVCAAITRCHLLLAAVQELLFVFALDWGVVGAALAPAIGQYVGLAVMVGLLIREKALYAADLRHVPTMTEVMPLLQVSAGFCYQWFLLPEMK